MFPFFDLCFIRIGNVFFSKKRVGGGMNFLHPSDFTLPSHAVFLTWNPIWATTSGWTKKKDVRMLAWDTKYKCTFAHSRSSEYMCALASSFAESCYFTFFLHLVSKNVSRWLFKHNSRTCNPKNEHPTIIRLYFFGIKKEVAQEYHQKLNMQVSCAQCTCEYD